MSTVLPGRSPVASLLDAAVWRPLWHAAGRNLVAIVAIALGVALGYAVELINRVASDEVQHAASSLFGTADLTIRGSALGFDELWYPRLAKLDGVASASPVVEVQARVPGHVETLKLIGIDAFRARSMQPAAVAGVSAGGAAATAMLADDAVWLSPAAARLFGVGEGDDLVVQVALEDVRLRVTGLLPASEFRQPLGMLDIATAQWRLHRLGRLDRIDLRLAPGASIAAVERAIAAQLPPGVRITTPDESVDDAVSLTRAYRSNLTALALVALFTGGFLVFTTQSLGLAHRRREFALLHALGVTRREQFGLALASGALLGAIGAGLGLVLGYAVARLGLATLGTDLGAGYFRGSAPPLVVRPQEWALFLALGIAAAVAASIGPAREAARVPTAQALKSGDEPPRTARSHALAALLLLALALIALLLKPVHGLPLPGYVAIALLLIAAVLVTPLICELVYGLLPTAGAAWRTIAAAQLRGTAARANISVAAILVSFSLMVAMAIMVASFRESLDEWVQRILPADVYVRVGASTQTAYLDVEAQRALAGLDGVRRAEFLRYVDVVMPDGQPLNVIARPIDEASAERLLAIRQRSQRPPEPHTVPVWVSEAAHDLHGLDVDSVFDLPLGGRTVRANVRGLWRDYEQRAGGGVVLDRAQYIALTGDTRAATAALWLEPGISAAAVAARVRAALHRDDGVMVAEPREIRRLSLKTFDRTFAVTYLLEAVAVAIGLFGIGASTSAQVLARRAEFGMLRHLGVTRAEIARMLAFEGAVQGKLGALLGLVVGAVIGIVLIYVINRQSFHWSMDVHVPWLALGVLSLALIASAALTAAWSGRAALRDDVVSAVKEDW
jgi:putative ABC transport system permease protein